MRPVVELCDRMPFEPSARCPVCDAELDPLRAPEALAFDDGIVLACQASCAEALRMARKQGRRATPPGATPKPGEGFRGEELTQLHELESVEPMREPVAAPVATLVVSFGSAALALVPSTGTRVAALALLASTAGASVLGRRHDLAQTLPRGIEALSVFVLCVAAALDNLHPRYLLAAAAAALLTASRPWLSDRGRAPVQRLARALVKALPREVRVPLDEVEDPATVASRSVETRRVHAGDLVLVEEGETLAVDGVIQVGRVVVQATAASLQPVEREAGDPVLAGARVVRGAASVLATRVGDARALSRAARSTAASGKLAMWGAQARRGVTLGLYAAACALLAWLLAADWAAGLAGWAIAMVGYPLLGLTLGLEIPALAARVCAAEQGMVFRDAQTLEDAGRVSSAALVADGTVAEPTRLVTEVLVYGRDMPLADLASLAMGLEASCEEHPIAQAIVAYGLDRGFQPQPVRRATHTPGKGIIALAAGGEPLAMGNRALLLSAGVSVAVAERDAQAAESTGRSVVFLAVDGRVRALFVLDYQVRPQARGALQTLIDLGADVALLSGDHRATVEAFAATLDITHVKAELNRDERAAEIVRLRETGGLVAAIGRLPDDEAVLAEADIGVALNGAGGAAADIELALATDDIADAARALSIAHATYRRQRRTLAISLGVSLASGLLALAGIGPPALWPLVLLNAEAWVMPSGEPLLARLRSVGIVGSVRPASP